MPHIFITVGPPFNVVRGDVVLSHSVVVVVGTPFFLTTSPFAIVWCVSLRLRCCYPHRH